LIVNVDDDRFDSYGINFKHQENFHFGDAITKKIQTILGKNDSDMAVYL